MSIGKDSDYSGGTFLREIDRGLQSIGLSRNSQIMRNLHAIEHNRRANIAEKQGDHERAQAERERAKANLTNNNAGY